MSPRERRERGREDQQAKNRVSARNSFEVRTPGRGGGQGGRRSTHEQGTRMHVS